MEEITLDNTVILTMVAVGACILVGIAFLVGRHFYRKYKIENTIFVLYGMRTSDHPPTWKGDANCYDNKVSFEATAPEKWIRQNPASRDASEITIKHTGVFFDNADRDATYKAIRDYIIALELKQSRKRK